MTGYEKRKILIVDDEKINSTILESILSFEYDTKIANNGAEALKEVDKYVPDIILLDIVMPGMTGIEVLEKLKSNADTRDIPVIMITGLNDSNYEEQGLSLGAADYITKPYSPTIVKLRIKNLLHLNTLNEEIRKAEIAEERSKAKSDFLAKMSHEIRTPMNSILGFTELALDSENITNQVADYLQRILENTQFLTDLVNEILDFSNFEFKSIDTLEHKAKETHPPDKIAKPRFKGLVLICDDNISNQHVIYDNLKRVGLEAIIAENGEHAIEIIKDRSENNQQLFDLILMDMLMPVMGGIETIDQLKRLGNKTPIIAMTANIMPEDIENYKEHGIKDCLGKPFSSQELWHLLLKYLTPTDVIKIDKTSLIEEDEKLLKHLRINFVKSNQTTYEDIIKAINENDIELAERMSHTLKSNAGQINETTLQKAAKNVEAKLKEMLLVNLPKNMAEMQLNEMKTELESVLEKLTPVYGESITSTQTGELSYERISEIFKKLKPLLETHNPECMTMVDEIRQIPGAEALAEQIEDFEFKEAARILEALEN